MGSACGARPPADNGIMKRASGEQPKQRKTGGRNERLAAALRENLRRRKAQARGRDPQSAALPSGSGQAPEDKTGG